MTGSCVWRGRLLICRSGKYRILTTSDRHSACGRLQRPPHERNTMTLNERSARAALSRLMEPQDGAGLALVSVVGAADALRIATGQVAAGPGVEQGITAVLVDNGAGPQWSGLGAALKRWAPRVPDLAPERDLATMQRLGGRLIIPGEDLWPGQLADLGIH